MSKMNEQIVNLLVEAAGESFKSLFKKHKERFYYCSMIMPEDSCPFISAWSHEALERFAAESDDAEETLKMCKWSYADSPYCAYGYDEFFSKVKALFQSEKNGIDLDLWMNSMEKAMSILDKSGIFNCVENRADIVINAEIMPPELSNTERALRLNPIASLTDWLEECSEEEDDESEEDERLCDVIIIKPVLDKKEVLKIKKAFCNDDGIAKFLKGTSNPSFKIKNGMKYTEAKFVMSKYPEFNNYIDIRII